MVIQDYFKRTLNVFLFLGIIFIPFSFNIFPYQALITEVVFNRLIQFVGLNVFGIEQYYFEVSSDSSSMFILVFILAFLAFLLPAFLPKSKQWKYNEKKIYGFLHTLFCYYLALQLLNYGVDKIFKSQFYLPEPNILFTPFGQLDKDILFWSTMGVSYTYNLFLGGIQILAATLILFRKSRVLGLLIAVAIFTNIIAINFSYDISVKLYTSFLFLLTIGALVPFISSLYQFFILKSNANLRGDSTNFSLSTYRKYQPFVKGFIAVLILFEVLIPYLKSGQFNDDLVERPYLHGAYELQDIKPLDSTVKIEYFPFERLFIHRNGYLIFQDENDAMADYKLNIDTIKNQFVLTDYDLNQRTLDFQYSSVDSLLYLQYFHQGNECGLVLKSVEWQALPVLKNQFHWWIDE